MKSRPGRPRIKKSEQRMNVVFTISPKSKKILDAECKRTGFNRGMIFERLLKTQSVGEGL